MLIDMIANRLLDTEALSNFWESLGYKAADNAQGESECSAKQSERSAKKSESSVKQSARSTAQNDAALAQTDATLSVASTARPMLIAAQFAMKPRPTLVVVSGEKTAEMFARNIASYLGDNQVMVFPGLDDALTINKKSNPATVARRAHACWSLQTGDERIVVASAKSLVRTLPPAQAKTMQPLKLNVGDEVCDALHSQGATIYDLYAKLEIAGYVNTGKLDGAGTFCYKGDVLDIYPGNTTYPVRIDFFGDEIEEIRRIVPSTGQTITNLTSIEIYPAVEFPLTKRNRARTKKELKKLADNNSWLCDLMDSLESETSFDGHAALLPYVYSNTQTLGDYLHKSALSVLVEPRSLIDDATRAYEDEMARLANSKISHADLLCPAAKINFGLCERVIYMSIMKAGLGTTSKLSLQRPGVVGNIEKLFSKIKSLIAAHYIVVFSAPNYRACQEMMLQFVENSIAVQDITSVGAAQTQDITHGKAAQTQDITSGGAAHPQHPKQDHLKLGVVNITDVEIPAGMIIPDAKLALISVYDTQRYSAGTHTPKSIDITKVTFPYKPGDYVVHAHHGIAYFKDLVKQEIGGIVRDYLLLEYAEDDKLYVPVEQLDRVTKYVGPGGAAPRLTRLNTGDWSRAMNKAKRASRKLAFDLVDVYTRRSAAPGFAFSADNFAQREMEEAFPYKETPDQLRAIEDVKADMEAPRPMDRLICGDVGFGKTEVAMRAAFKAVQDKKQVMVLCPTTILAQQHFNSFHDRFAPFDVSVEVLSRFRSAREQKEALEGFKSGSVSVLVGTHRLLSRDVCPHDLGLVVVDEEQRFGVGHKEQLKNLRESVDVLTLSATPIPRTLQMSLSGVRDMSLILTPPSDRLPVEVYAGEWDADLVSGAIRREVQRGGQVYYVSNRVQSIEDARDRVLGAAEEVRVGVAHGQMNKDDLESIMESFCAGELDVLVATTIIESGIDNPHTNTLIIEDSQRLGLSQMYQLKGRVGRSNTQAYAYFMFPEHVNLTQEATARLSALCEHTQLGSGMRIAMKDLEIRGQGSMLGAEQSGNLSSVGFDLYAQMLEEALTSAKFPGTEGEKEVSHSRVLSDISINIPVHAYFPDEYIPDVDERVMWYRRAANCGGIEAADLLERDLLKAHPDIPDCANNLLLKTKIKAYAFEHNITNITISGGKITIEPVPAKIMTREKLAQYRKVRGRYIKDKRIFTMPAKSLESEDKSNLCSVFELLKGLFS